MHPRELDLQLPSRNGGLQGKPLREFWRRQFQVEELTLGDTAPHRLWCSWRLVRELARLKGFVKDDEWLSEALEVAVLDDDTHEPLGTRWDCPCPPERLHAPEARRYRGLLTNAAEVPLTPPGSYAHPLAVRRFDAEAFCLTMRQVASELHLELGSEQHPLYGRIGLEMLYLPDQIRELFPSPKLIQELEEHLAARTALELQEKPLREVRRVLTEEFGLLPREVKGAIRLGLRALALDFVMEIDERRAVMVGRLEDLAQRAREGLDLKTELNAMKISALIQGLTANKPEDEVADFVRVVAQISENGRERKQLEEAPDDDDDDA